MRFGIRYVSLAVVAAGVLGTAGCDGSGSSSGGGSGAALTADQVSTLLRTDKDEPGWMFSSLSDVNSTHDTQASPAAGDGACQTLGDAQDAVVPKYGTEIDIQRTLLQPTGSGSGMLLDEVAVLPSSAKAAALMSDLATGLKGCLSLTVPNGDGTQTSATVSANVPKPSPGHVSFTDHMSNKAGTIIITDMTQVGAEVIGITYVGSSKDDPAALQHFGPTVSQAAQTQAAHIKAFKG